MQSRISIAFVIFIAFQKKKMSVLPSVCLSQLLLYELLTHFEETGGIECEMGGKWPEWKVEREMEPMEDGMGGKWNE